MNMIKNQHGVTLIEMIVSVAIFSVIMLSALGIFKMVIESQRNAISSQNIQEGMRYALEMMAKEIRSAQINVDCAPIGPKRVYNSNSATELHFENKDGRCVSYNLNGNRIQVQRGAAAGYLTGNKIKVSNLSFSVNDNDLNTPPYLRIQPSVTIRMDVESVLGKAENKQTMQIQTSVSSRFYE